MNITITNTATGEVRRVTIAQAAEIMNIDATEIEWAIEECGQCDGEEWTTQ
jgi:hypothetical protein